MTFEIGFSREGFVVVIGANIAKGFWCFGDGAIELLGGHITTVPELM